MVVVFLLIGLRLVLKKPPSHLTAYTGEAGSVLVSRKALQELVRAACISDKNVQAARPVIRVKNDKVTARVELRLAKAENLKAVCQSVQDQITSLLQKSLSFDQIGTIEIVVKSFGKEKELSESLPPQDSSNLPTSPQSDKSLAKGNKPSPFSPTTEKSPNDSSGS